MRALLLIPCFALSLAAQTIRLDPAVTQTPSAAEILKASAQVYARCTTYQDEGTVTSVFKSKDFDHKGEKHFTTAFSRANGFRFEFWEKDVADVFRRFVVAKAGSEVKSWWSLDQKVRTNPSLADALSTATGISGGAAYTVPSTLAAEGAWKGQTWTTVGGAVRVEDKNLDGAPCFRIQRLMSTAAETRGSVPVPASQGRATYWVRKKDHVLLRVERETDFGTFTARETTTYKPLLDAFVPPAALAFGH